MLNWFLYFQDMLNYCANKAALQFATHSCKPLILLCAIDALYCAIDTGNLLILLRRRCAPSVPIYTTYI